MLTLHLHLQCKVSMLYNICWWPWLYAHCMQLTCAFKLMSALVSGLTKTSTWLMVYNICHGRHFVNTSLLYNLLVKVKHVIFNRECLGIHNLLCVWCTLAHWSRDNPDQQHTHTSPMNPRVPQSQYPSCIEVQPWSRRQNFSFWLRWNTHSETQFMALNYSVRFSNVIYVQHSNKDPKHFWLHCRSIDALFYYCIIFHEWKWKKVGFFRGKLVRIRKNSENKKKIVRIKKNQSQK
jgi:hypothetical protein